MEPTSIMRSFVEIGEPLVIDLFAVSNARDVSVDGSVESFELLIVAFVVAVEISVEAVEIDLASVVDAIVSDFVNSSDVPDIVPTSAIAALIIALSVALAVSTPISVAPADVERDDTSPADEIVSLERAIALETDIVGSSLADVVSVDSLTVALLFTIIGDSSADDCSVVC